MQQLPQDMLSALQGPIAAAVRWSGAIARQLRRFNIAITGKTSGNASTDALTLADLAVQELLVAALRDCGEVFRHCRMEAEENTGDLAAFQATGELTIALDPIDGTQKFRDRTGDGYGVLLHIRNATDVIYSLGFFPEIGSVDGTWVQVYNNVVHCGLDQPRQPAHQVLADLPQMTSPSPAPLSVYVVGFRHEDPLKAQAVTQAGLRGVPLAELPSSIFPLLATGAFAGALFQTPNVYDFPLVLHIARSLGGNAVWVHNQMPVHFRNTWIEAEVDMVRLPGIVACAVHPSTLQTLVKVARDWTPRRAMD